MGVWTSVVTSKGQLVVPASLRRRYGISKGTRLAFLDEDGRLTIQPINAAFFRSLRGSWQSTPTLGVLLRERKRDKRR